MAGTGLQETQHNRLDPLPGSLQPIHPSFLASREQAPLKGSYQSGYQQILMHMNGQHAILQTSLVYLSGHKINTGIAPSVCQVLRYTLIQSALSANILFTNKSCTPYSALVPRLCLIYGSHVGLSAHHYLSHTVRLQLSSPRSPVQDCTIPVRLLESHSGSVLEYLARPRVPGMPPVNSCTCAGTEPPISKF